MVLPSYWEDTFPEVRAVASSIKGADLLNTEPFSFEVKARNGLDLMAWMRQARGNTAAGSIPTLIVRMNGQGPQNIGEWFAVTRQQDFKRLAKAYLIHGAT